MHCPACSKSLGHSPQGELAACEGCGLRFAWPMEAASPEWYAQSGIYSGEGAALVHDPRHLWALEQLPGGGSLLDLGCGSGAFLDAATQRGLDAQGVDMQPELVTRAIGAGHRARCMDLHEALAEPGRAYRVITIFDVLEHLADPGALAAAVLKRLEPGGRAVVSVPRADRYPQVFDPVIDGPPHHLTLWTPDALKALFQSRGAQSVQVHGLPLTAQDLYLHHLWRKYGHGPMATTRRDGLARRALGLKVAALALLGRARGHTLMAAVQA